jgi:hypothetical protein
MVHCLPDLLVSLPTAIIPEYLDLEALAKYFNSVLEVLAPIHFIENAVWRDHFAVTGSLRTFYGGDTITAAWADICMVHEPSSFAIRGKPQLVCVPKHSWVEIGFTFETNGTPGLTCSGFMSVVHGEDGAWKIWLLKTILEGIKGQPSCDELEPVNDAHREGRLVGVNGVNGVNKMNGVRETTASTRRMVSMRRTGSTRRAAGMS